LLALWTAFCAPERRVLIMSAGDDAAKDLLAQCVALANSPLLRGAVLDESASRLVLSNGSIIESVPASMRRVRGKVADLLIIDEAAFVEDELWSASQYTVLSRPESRVVLASTPWGRPDRFFAAMYRAGERGEHGIASFHWPSTASPLVDRTLLEMWRTTSPDREYRREVLAEWVDDHGAYFSSEEIAGSVDDTPMVTPENARGMPVWAGVDWGFAKDASALAVMKFERDIRRVVWVEERAHMPYAKFVERVAEVGRGYRFRRVASELNGVGAMPTQELSRRLGSSVVVGVHTTADTKEDGFGRLKMLMQSGRLCLPRHPALLAQLSALEFTERDSGSVHVAVPERAGHDDLAMALCLAAGVMPEQLPRQPGGRRVTGRILR
jgi:phage FluMu gp28-like protein